jgi:branched-chain amino acid transport system ATP-binding protein
MLSITNLEVSIGNINILNSISFKVSKFSSIIGRNGAGKTTLIRSIMNILPAKKGNIKFNNESLNNKKTYEMTELGIGYMPEDRRLVPDLSVKDNILVPLWSLNKNKIDDELDEVVSFIPEIKKFLSREAYQLSGGQQKLVALARAMIVGKDLLLLDEPFEGVAPALAERLVELLSELNKSNLITMITESDESFSKIIKADIIRIERGKIL